MANYQDSQNGQAHVDRHQHRSRGVRRQGRRVQEEPSTRASSKECAKDGDDTVLQADQTNTGVSSWLNSDKSGGGTPSSSSYREYLQARGQEFMRRNGNLPRGSGPATQPPSQIKSQPPSTPPAPSTPPSSQQPLTLPGVQGSMGGQMIFTGTQPVMACCPGPSLAGDAARENLVWPGSYNNVKSPVHHLQPHPADQVFVQQDPVHHVQPLPADQVFVQQDPVHHVQSQPADQTFVQQDPVHHVQPQPADQQLVHQENVDLLRNCRVGVDAVFWLRSIEALKDPLADALGGIPPGIFGVVDKELEMFGFCGMTPLFVFQGVAPGRQQSTLVDGMDQKLAWTYTAKGRNSEAQSCPAASTDHINGDLVHFIFHHLRHKGYECMQAPYFAGAQLAHFAEQGVVQTVFGPPGLLVYGVQSVVVHVDFTTQTFDWVDLDSVLQKWQISRDQFVDACVLAGGEDCLTYPYLKLGHFQPAAPGSFNFDDAVCMIKQAPLISWIPGFTTEDMTHDRVDGYCTNKALVQNSPVLDLSDCTIRPLGASASGLQPPQVPYDFATIMGEKLPTMLYYLMLNGVVSHKLPQALAKGEWTDKSQPVVDTAEFRDLLQDLTDYRQTALGLIANHLHPNFQTKSILCKAFWDPDQVRQGKPGNEDIFPQGARVMQPNKVSGLAWNINANALKKEMRRQGVDKVDFKFCAQWHAHEFDNDGPLIPNAGSARQPHCGNDANSLSALVHLMVLEHVGLIADDGGMTVLGNVLKDTPRHLQESTLVALEMMKFGMMTSEPFNNAQAEKHFPEHVNYPTQPWEPRMKAILLMTRVMSLVPMKLKNDMWNADVDFDLAAFHSLVRVLKRTLRQLTEASLASVLLKDPTKVKLLTPGFMCASPEKEDHLQTPAMLPTFMPPRVCMGIVVRYFLDYTGDAGSFHKDVQQRFPCCLQPVEDLVNAFTFWEDLRRCVGEIAEPLECGELLEEMRFATEQYLAPMQRKLGISP